MNFSCGADALTVNTADVVPLFPSCTLTSLIDTVTFISLSMIFPFPIPPLSKSAFTGLTRSSVASEARPFRTYQPGETIFQQPTAECDHGRSSPTLLPAFQICRRRPRRNREAFRD